MWVVAFCSPSCTRKEMMLTTLVLPGCAPQHGDCWWRSQLSREREGAEGAGGFLSPGCLQRAKRAIEVLISILLLLLGGGVGKGEQGVSPTQTGWGRPHAWPLRDETDQVPLAASSEDTSGKMAGAGSEAFGVWMKEKSKQSPWQPLSRTLPPLLPQSLLRWVPKERRVLEGGRRARNSDDKMHFLSQLVCPAST